MKKSHSATMMIPVSFSQRIPKNTKPRSIEISRVRFYERRKVKVARCVSYGSRKMTICVCVCVCVC